MAPPGAHSCQRAVLKEFRRSCPPRPGGEGEGAPPLLSLSLISGRKQLIMSAAVRGAPAGPSTRMPVARRGQLTVVNAISRQKKEKIVGDLQALLENSNVAIGMSYKGLTVADLQVGRPEFLSRLSPKRNYSCTFAVFDTLKLCSRRGTARGAPAGDAGHPLHPLAVPKPGLPSHPLPGTRLLRTLLCFYRATLPRHAPPGGVLGPRKMEPVLAARPVFSAQVPRYRDVSVYSRRFCSNARLVMSRAPYLAPSRRGRALNPSGHRFAPGRAGHGLPWRCLSI